MESRIENVCVAVTANSPTIAEPINPGTQHVVRFSPTVGEKHIIHINDMSREDIHNTWYSQEEYNDIKANLKATVRLAMGGLIQIDQCSQICLRGVEHIFKQGALLRKSNRLNALEGVLYEQSRQLQESDDSAETIAEIYGAAAARSRRTARVLGMRDAVEAREIPTKSSEFEWESPSKKIRKTRLVRRSLKRRF